MTTFRKYKTQENAFSIMDDSRNIPNSVYHYEITAGGLTWQVSEGIVGGDDWPIWETFDSELLPTVH